MIIAYLIEAIKQKNLKHFGKATLACAAGAIIGIMLNVSNLYHTWQYSQESMRGKSELVKKNTANQTNSGLDRDYITQWSYGIDETWTLLVPNTKGGASVPLASNAKAMEKADPNFMQVYQQMGQYWGEQPGTSEYHDRTGKITRWSNATFSGMPTYQTAPTYKSTSFLQQVIRAYHLWLPENVWYVFAYLLGFYILLRAFNFKETLAALVS